MGVAPMSLAAERQPETEAAAVTGAESEAGAESALQSVPSAGAASTH
jgi:hypothetical protein